MSSELKHNRKRNSGLVYELLIRHLTSCLLEKDRKGYKKALDLVHKYYSPGSPLSQERELFEIVKESRSVNRSLAQRIVSEIMKFSRQMDVRKIEKEKSNLIKEINYGLGRDFFGRHRIPDYRFFASVYMLIDMARRGTVLSENVARIKLEESLISFMCSDREDQRPSVNPEIDSVVFTLAVKKFREKYGASLSENQKTILEGYLNCLVDGSQASFLKILAEEKVRIGKSLDSCTTQKEFREDQIMRSKLDEVRASLEKLDCSSLSDGLVEEIMLHHRLVEEIKSNERN